MKKIFTLLVIMSIALGIQAQDSRVVLIEQFTQASCPPCAPANVRIQNILKNYPETEVVILRYQASFPGFDPMYNHNKKDVNNKQSYYSIRSVPGSVIDGQMGPDHPNTIINTTNLNARKRVAPGCRIECTPSTSKDGKQIMVHAKITALKDFVGNEAATIAIIEKHIHFDKPPGGNGEKDFFNVMKKLLPTANGQPLPKLKKGEAYEFDVEWELQNIYSIPQVAMIAFVQQRTSKEVYQALHIPQIIQSPYANDATIGWISIDNGPEDNTTCNTYASPQIELISLGNKPMTTATIEYSVNGSTPQQFTWKGNLGFYESEVVQLNEISFGLTEDNTMKAKIISVNEENDENASNNTYEDLFDLAPITSNKMIVDLRSMTRPNRMSFSIMNSLKEEVYSAGPFKSSEKSIKKEIDLKPNECYEIIINNTAPGSSNGRVTVKDDAGQVIYATRHIPYGLNRTHFTTNPTISAKDVTGNSNLSWNISPNPAGYSTTLSVTTDTRLSASISVQSLMGQELRSFDVLLTKGDNSIHLPLENLSNGVYFITLRYNDTIPITKKLIVRH